MKETKTILLYALVGCALAFVPGCDSKKKLEQTAELLRTAAETDNYEGFKALAHPLLLEKFPPPQLTRVSKALKQLGAFQERTMTGIEVKAGGRHEANFTLRYEKGSVKLKIAIVAGKVVAFNFSGDDLTQALRAEQLKRFSKFEVAKFAFLDKPGGTAKANNIYKAGEPIAFKMQVNGLTMEKEKIHFSGDIKVTSDAETIFSKPAFAGTKEPIPSKGLPVGTLTGTIKLPKVPATYIAHFKINDLLGKRSLEHKQSIVLQAP